MAVDGGRLWIFLLCFWIQLSAAKDVVDLGKPLNILPSQFWYEPRATSLRSANTR